jgi:transcriptional regulator with GAF, ATPase, and Fis domain
MLGVPSRKGLVELAAAAGRVVPCLACGFAREIGPGRVSVLYHYQYGFGAFALSEDAAPAVMTTAGNEILEAGEDVLAAHSMRAVEWLLRFGGCARLISLPLPDVTPAGRFWLSTSRPDALSDAERTALSAVALAAARLLTEIPSREESAERLRRLELTAQLMPALLRVLDIRDVFDRLSEIARQALPHDLLLLRLFNADLSKITTFARTGKGTDLGPPDIALPYPPEVARAWEFDIIDDLRSHPLEADKAPAMMGARASLRMPIRFDDQLIGGVAVMSFETHRYSTDDVSVARRLADHVAVALSHQNLAERLAEQARSAEELRARATSLELLDELLGAVTDIGGLSEVFRHISGVARKVLRHDAAALMVRLPDGRHARLYASAGFTPAPGDITQVPAELLQNPEWEYGIVDELARESEPSLARLATEGFHALLRVPIRLDGRFAGALIFVATTPAAFRAEDVPVARRMADRMAVALARDREFEASKRADEATERAQKLEARVRALTEELDARTGYRRVIGESIEWRQVLTQATQVAATDTTVLLLGESGTGKEVAARFVHRASTRSQGPFIALNCAALPEQLLEAELFGYERGAYTGAIQSKPGQLEQAAGGTLFLDEVGEMSPSAQAKFLRVLQEREFQRLGGTRVLRTDARVIAATNRDLQRAIANGHFREDLYYRLNVFAITLPALRHRRADVLPLSEAFLNEIGRGLGRPPGGITRDARQMLIDYPWPGNVRELRNVLERAAILCDGGLITPDHLALMPPPAAPVSPAAAPTGAAAVAAATTPEFAAMGGGLSGMTPPTSAADLQSIERAMIEQALQTARFNKSKAAKALGLTRHQLYIRMRKYGFE